MLTKKISRTFIATATWVERTCLFRPRFPPWVLTGLTRLQYCTRYKTNRYLLQSALGVDSSQGDNTLCASSFAAVRGQNIQKGYVIPTHTEFQTTPRNHSRSDLFVQIYAVSLLTGLVREPPKCSKGRVMPHSSRLKTNYFPRLLH